MNKLDETTENIKSRVINIEEKSEKLSRDIDSVGSNKNQMDQVNAQVIFTISNHGLAMEIHKIGYLQRSRLLYWVKNMVEFDWNYILS